MLLRVTALLPIVLFLASGIKAHNGEDHDDDTPVSDCIPKCVSTYAANVKTFSCEYLKSNSPLVACINECPVTDIESYVDHLNLKDHCEEDLFPSEKDDNDDDDNNTTQTRTVIPTPTATDRVPEDHGDDDCNDPNDDDWKTSNWSSWCTKHVSTRVSTTGIPTATDQAVTTPTTKPTNTPNTQNTGKGNTTVTETQTSGTTVGPSPTPSGDDDGAGISSFGNPSAAVIVVGFMAWIFLL